MKVNKSREFLFIKEEIINTALDLTREKDIQSRVLCYIRK